MADQKISELTELAVPPAITDMFAIADMTTVPETPQTKKIQINRVLGFKAGLDALSDLTYHGITLTGRNYGEEVAVGQLVYLDDTAGEWMVADADEAGHWPARGIAVLHGHDGDPATILVLGVMRNDAWGFTEGQSLYLSDSGTTRADAGVVSGTAPVGSGDCVQIVGFALSDDEAFFNFTGVYAEHS